MSSTIIAEDDLILTTLCNFLLQEFSEADCDHLMDIGTIDEEYVSGGFTWKVTYDQVDDGDGHYRDVHIIINGEQFQACWETHENDDCLEFQWVAKNN